MYISSYNKYKCPVSSVYEIIKLVKVQCHAVVLKLSPDF